MCGIVGVIPRSTNGFFKPEQDIFYQLLWADQLRGSDATGVITCHNNGDFGIMKEAVAADWFLPQYNGSDLDKDLFKNGCAVIGHNRAKTIGENKDENAHPFVVDGTFAMVHNGTLRNHKALGYDTAVDSEALAKHFKKAMEEEDFVQALSEAVWKVHGAFACVWYDQKRQQVGVIRNSERPLHYIETTNAVIFGSEIGMISWITARNGQSITKHSVFKEDTLYLFDVSKGGAQMKEFPLSPKPVKTKTFTGTGTTHGTGTFMGGTSINSAPFSRKITDVLASQVEGKCSKNQFKRLRNKLVGQTVKFELDDYVECDFPQTGGSRFILLGFTVDCLDLQGVRHTTQGMVDCHEHGMTIKDLPNQDLWEGKISRVEFMNSIGQVQIFFQDVKPYKQKVLH